VTDFYYLYLHRNIIYILFYDLVLMLTVYNIHKTNFVCKHTKYVKIRFVYSRGRRLMQYELTRTESMFGMSVQAVNPAKIV
jgi:hypothetical protein